MPETPQLPNGWNAWGNHVLKALESNELEHKDINTLLNKMVTKMAVIETKMAIRAGFTGLISGGVMSIVVAIVIWLITKEAPVG